jgi:hypothetical protein
MQGRTTRRLKPRRGRAKASLVVLSGLLALAGAAQVLAPASAAALTNQAGCRNVLDLGYIEVCLDDENGGGSEGVGPGGNENITITDTKPDVNPCIANPSACLPRQPSSGSDRIRDDLAGYYRLVDAYKEQGSDMRHLIAKEMCKQLRTFWSSLNGADVLSYEREVQKYTHRLLHQDGEQDPHFLAKPWLGRRFEQVKKIQDLFENAYNCDGALPGT